MTKLTQAKATKIAKEHGLKAVVSGNTIYVYALLATVNQANPKYEGLPSLTPELDLVTDHDVGYQCAAHLMNAINGKPYEKPVPKASQIEVLKAWADRGVTLVRDKVIEEFTVRFLGGLTVPNPTLTKQTPVQAPTP